MRSWLFFLLLAAAGLLVNGCATPDSNSVSTIPWNRPQSWEGNGALGSMINPTGTP